MTAKPRLAGPTSVAALILFAAGRAPADETPPQGSGSAIVAVERPIDMNVGAWHADRIAAYGFDNV